MTRSGILGTHVIYVRLITGTTHGITEVIGEDITAVFMILILTITHHIIMVIIINTEPSLQHV